MNTKDEKFIVYYVRPTIKDEETKHMIPAPTARPVGCVVTLITDDGVFCRGISICSSKDNFTYDRARNDAIARCCLARKTGTAHDGDAGVVYEVCDQIIGGTIIAAAGNEITRAAGVEFLRCWERGYGGEPDIPVYKVHFGAIPTMHEQHIYKRAGLCIPVQTAIAKPEVKEDEPLVPASVESTES